jgi:hypothetical protein
MSQTILTQLKMAEMRATTEGHNLLIRLIKNPGMVVSSSDVDEYSLIESINEGGGSIWWCKKCEILCSPIRPCTCTSNFFLQHEDDKKDSTILDPGELPKYNLALSQDEFEHILRSLKFCKHNKSKHGLHPNDKSWMDGLSIVISKMEGIK